MVGRPDSLVNPRKKRTGRTRCEARALPETWRAEFRLRLHAWYSRTARDLPWRATRDPHAILVSEMMLQQTQVATVIPYYGRFLERFPTVASLAAADEAAVLAQWAGLGYYRRARLLHAAAQAVIRDHGGEFPRTAAGLASLPGVGPYTAGAVASFAFDAREALVDANAARLLARLTGWRNPLNTTESSRVLWDIAEALLPPHGARVHNNAVMELGAMVCTPQAPQCGACPVSALCVANRTGSTAAIPVLPERPKTIPIFLAGAVFLRGRRYLVRRIPAGEWHAGMWEFPKATISSDDSSEAERAVHRLAEAMRFQCAPQPLGTVRYTVTNHRVLLKVYAGRVRSRGPVPEGHRWATLEVIRSLPLGSPQKRIVKMLEDSPLIAGKP
jgi:A/G-specific adenine glycosylase